MAVAVYSDGGTILYPHKTMTCEEQEMDEQVTALMDEFFYRLNRLLRRTTVQIG